MSNAQQPKRSSPASPPKRGDFNWPPTDDEMGVYENNLAETDPIFDESDVEALGAAAVEESHAVPGVSPEAAAAADAGDLSASERIAPGDWTGEIARLQTMIKGLTEKIEWR